MDRRTFIGCTGGITLLGGCIGSNLRPTRLGRLTIANFTSETVDIAVRASYNDSVVYDQTHKLQAHNDSDPVVPSVSITEPFPREPGRYVIEYGLEGETNELINISEIATSDCGQIALDVRTEQRIESFYSDGCDTINK